MPTTKHQAAQGGNGGDGAGEKDKLTQDHLSRTAPRHGRARQLSPTRGQASSLGDAVQDMQCIHWPIPCLFMYTAIWNIPRVQKPLPRRTISH